MPRRHVETQSRSQRVPQCDVVDAQRLKVVLMLTAVP